MTTSAETLEASLTISGRDLAGQSKASEAHLTGGIPPSEVPLPLLRLHSVANKSSQHAAVSPIWGSDHRPLAAGPAMRTGRRHWLVEERIG
ncbi:unnamed protein product [Spirodela intermedia]|uniref:Uncharacterized protein n=1 Tax=Spirodela intermedia TaxID=51605 RepID=A0A7I8JWH8_SPIIN|nr:unnamed protein product [Spirodela intermedia]